jgi:hypothetical protein
VIKDRPKADTSPVNALDWFSHRYPYRAKKTIYFSRSELVAASTLGYTSPRIRRLSATFFINIVFQSVHYLMDASPVSIN